MRQPGMAEANQPSSRALLCAEFCGKVSTIHSWVEATTCRVPWFLGQPRRWVLRSRVLVGPGAGTCSRLPGITSPRWEPSGWVALSFQGKCYRPDGFRALGLFKVQWPRDHAPRCGSECSRPATGQRFCHRQFDLSPASAPHGRSPQWWPPQRLR